MITNWKNCGLVLAATLALACTAHAADAAARGPLMNGPLLQGLSMNGPLIQGIALNGPLIQGIRLNGPVFQGVAFNGPILQGVRLNGVLMSGPTTNQGPVLYGRGRGVFAMPAGFGLHVVPGHSPFSGIASSDVRVTMTQ